MKRQYYSAPTQNRVEPPKGVCSKLTTLDSLLLAEDRPAAAHVLDAAYTLAISDANANGQTGSVFKPCYDP